MLSAVWVPQTKLPRAESTPLPPELIDEAHMGVSLMFGQRIKMFGADCQFRPVQR